MGILKIWGRGCKLIITDLSKAGVRITVHGFCKHGRLKIYKKVVLTVTVKVMYVLSLTKFDTSSTVLGGSILLYNLW